MKKNNKAIISSAIESVYRATYGQIPIVGTVLTELAFDFSGRIKQNRLNLFSEKLKSYFESIGEGQVNTENILTEDFHDLFEAILKQIAFTKSERKMERFKNIVVGQIKSPSEFESVERFIEITARLTESQVSILLFYYTNVELRNKYNEQISQLSLNLDETSHKYGESNAKLELMKTNRSILSQNNSDLTDLDVSIELQQQQVMKEFKKRNDTSNEIEKIKLKRDKTFGGIDHDQLGISKSECEYLLSDLASLSLLEKRAATAKKRISFSYYKITSFGKNYIEFVENI